MAQHARAQALDESDPLLADIAKLVVYPDAWLDTPNYSLGGQRPRDLLQTEKGRAILYNLVESVKHGFFT
jgi:uncharacterized protein (DUF2384 family)